MSAVLAVARGSDWAGAVAYECFCYRNRVTIQTLQGFKMVVLTKLKLFAYGSGHKERFDCVSSESVVFLEGGFLDRAKCVTTVNNIYLF